MVITKLFPSGVLQFTDVLQNGYWHTRSAEFLHDGLMPLIEWLRLPADLIFLVIGFMPLIMAIGLKYVSPRKSPAGRR